MERWAQAFEALETDDEARQLLAEVYGFPRDAETSLEHNIERYRICRALATRVYADEPSLYPAAITYLLNSYLKRAGRLRESLDSIIDTLEHHSPDVPGGAYYRDLLLLQRAQLERALGRYDDSAQHLDQLEALAGQDPGMLVRIQGERALLHLELGAPDEAGPFADLALELAHSLPPDEKNRSFRLITAYDTAIQVEFGRGDFEHAALMIRACLGIEGLFAGRDAQRHAMESQLGLCLLREGQFEDALVQLEDSLAGGLEGPAKAAALRYLAEAYAASGRDAEGLLHVRSAKAVAQEGTDLHDTLLMWEAHLALRSGADPAELEPLRSALENAFERLHARWAETDEREGGRGFLLFRTRRGLLAQLIRLTKAIHGAERSNELALDLLVRSQQLGTLAPGDAGEGSGMELCAGLLRREGHGLLFFLPAPIRSLVFAVDSNGVLQQELPDGEKIDKARWRYLSHLNRFAGRNETESSTLDEERRLARELSGLLFTDELWERIARWSMVSVTGTDLLEAVPFLWLPSPTAEHLVQERAWCELPSIPWAVAALASGPQAAETDLLLVGDPLGQALHDLPDLSLRAEDRARLSAPYPRSAGRFGNRATGEGLRAAPSSRVLQLLVHSVPEPGSSRRALALTPTPGDAGLVTYADVGQLPAADCVLLTSCRSGTGPRRRGDAGSVDLGGAWLRAGSRSVLATRHDWRLSSALRFSMPFHAALARGLSPAEACRRALLEASQASPAGAPFEFGPLAVYGLGHEPTFATPLPAPRADETPPARWVLWALVCVSGAARVALGRRRGSKGPRGIALRR